jgi:hypothetical protein
MQGLLDDGREIPAPAYCCIILQFPLAYVNQPKALVAKEVSHSKHSFEKNDYTTGGE